MISNENAGRRIRRAAGRMLRVLVWIGGVSSSLAAQAIPKFQNGAAYMRPNGDTMWYPVEVKYERVPAPPSIDIRDGSLAASPTGRLVIGTQLLAEFSRDWIERRFPATSGRQGTTKVSGTIAFNIPSFPGGSPLFFDFTGDLAVVTLDAVAGCLVNFTVNVNPLKWLLASPTGGASFWARQRYCKPPQVTTVFPAPVEMSWPLLLSRDSSVLKAGTKGAGQLVRGVVPVSISIQQRDDAGTLLLDLLGDFFVGTESPRFLLEDQRNVVTPAYYFDSPVVWRAKATVPGAGTSSPPSAPPVTGSPPPTGTAALTGAPGDIASTSSPPPVGQSPPGNSTCALGCFTARATGARPASFNGPAAAEVSDGSRYAIMLRNKAYEGHYIALDRMEGGIPGAGTFKITDTCGEAGYTADPKLFQVRYHLNDYSAEEQVLFVGKSGTITIESTEGGRARGRYDVVACRELGEGKAETVRLRGTFDVPR